MERALSIWPKGDILERAVRLWCCGKGEGSFHSSEGWLEKLEEWMGVRNMNMIELPSADCEAK
jgi:hypothetical protein